ncbi:MAG: hypothetical protein K2P75_04895 [Sphingobacteriaceae bacterium]|nr:hypothetical protein [Sphingobacteriaceae bacterium]
MSLFGKNLICTQDWSIDELLLALNLAVKMKKSRFHSEWKTLLDSKTFIMLFYNHSLRTRISFEAAMLELGGHAQFIMPPMLRLQTNTEAGETVQDAARVMSRYAAGIGIRIAEAAIPYYGAGNNLMADYVKWADVPVINMANDYYHPCQGLADILSWAERYGNGLCSPNFESLKNKNFLLTWAHGGMARTWGSVHEALLLASRFGMNVTIARPDGYDLDPQVYQTIAKNCQMHDTAFTTTNNHLNCYENAHVVYSRNWMSPHAYKDNVFQKEAEIKFAMEKKEWITTAEKMKKTDNAIFTHCMPIDRGFEVTDEVANSDRSVIYDVAENRLHVQKAVLALSMSQRFLD